MIYFDQLPLSEGILQALSLLKIDYVFQPIFKADGKSVYAWEALMRPHNTTVTELIQEYTEIGQLHILEVATFFGAMQAYILRGYTEKVSINSFPSECFTDEEGKVFDDYFGDISGNMIIEMLEYPEMILDKWLSKKKATHDHNNDISLDDYGTGINDMDTVDLVNPAIVKLDRSLISDIDVNEDKQENCEKLVNILHAKKKLVVAEGIERKEEFDFLTELGVDLFQGYYLARPS